MGIHSGPTAAEVEASEEGGVTVVRYGGDFLATCKAVGDAAVVSGAGDGAWIEPFGCGVNCSVAQCCWAKGWLALSANVGACVW